MDSLDEPDAPLNPYSRAYFGLWGLIALLMIGFQLSNRPTQKSALKWSPSERINPCVKSDPLSVTFQAKSIWLDELERLKTR